ncbi:ferrous iron transporter A, partial [Haematococcus lacustris]
MAVAHAAPLPSHSLHAHDLPGHKAAGRLSSHPGEGDGEESDAAGPSSQLSQVMSSHAQTLFRMASLSSSQRRRSRPLERSSQGEEPTPPLRPSSNNCQGEVELQASAWPHCMHCCPAVVDVAMHVSTLPNRQHPFYNWSREPYSTPAVPDPDGPDPDGPDPDGPDPDGPDPDGPDPDGLDPDGLDPDGLDPDGVGMQQH